MDQVGTFSASMKYSLHSFRYVIIVALLILAMLRFATAQQSQGSKVNLLDKKKIAIQVKLSQDKVHAGSVCLALLIVNIQQGWHINSASPSEADFIGTSVDIQKSMIVDSVDIRYPKGVERNFGFSDTPLDVYEESVSIFVKLRIASAATRGTHLIPATVSYQACNDNVCLAPTSVRVNIPLTIVSQTEMVSRINQSLFDSYQK